MLRTSGRPLEGADRSRAPLGARLEALLESTNLCVATLVILIAIGLIALKPATLCPDVSGQFWLAHAMRRGARLYVDFIEINPPLWFWMAMPVDWLGELLRTRTEPVTIALVALWALVALRGTSRLLEDTDPKARTLFLLYASAVLLIMPMHLLFEQREHLALIAAVPYLALAARRSKAGGVRPVLAALIGFGGALGFALKPHFLAVPILTEAWLIYTIRARYRPFRPENLILLGSALLYVAAVALVTPEFFTLVLPHYYPVYKAAAPAFALSFDVQPLLWLFMLAALAPAWRAIRAGDAPLTAALLAGFGGFAISYAAQHTGWLYLGIPATGCLALALGAAVLEAGWPTGKTRLFYPALMMWPFGFVFVNTGDLKPYTDIRPAFAELRQGDAFGIISTVGWTSWDDLVHRGLVNSSRNGQYFMLLALDSHPEQPLVRQVANEAIHETVLDYLCLPPKVIVFTRMNRSAKNKYVFTDPYRFFIKDPEFRAMLSHYRLAMQYGMFDVYKPVTPLPPVDRRRCRNPGA